MSDFKLQNEKEVPEPDNSRRDFIVGSALAAGAATVGIGSNAYGQEAERYDHVKAPQLMTASFDARYQQKISRDDLFKVVDQMLEIAGCPTCGLAGIDLRLGLDPIFNVDSAIPVNVGIR